MEARSRRPCARGDVPAQPRQGYPVVLHCARTWLASSPAACADTQTGRHAQACLAAIPVVSGRHLQRHVPVAATHQLSTTPNHRGGSTTAPTMRGRTDFAATPGCSARLASYALGSL